MGGDSCAFSAVQLAESIRFPSFTFLALLLLMAKNDAFEVNSSERVDSSNFANSRDNRGVEKKSRLAIFLFANGISSQNVF